MTNEDILELVKQCDIEDGKELVLNKAYLYNRKFRENRCGRIEYVEEEIIVLVESGVKVGGIYRMGFEDIHVVIEEKYRGRHILSNFLRTGILGEVWPENTSVKLCGVYSKVEYDKKRHLAELCHMSINNEKEIEDRLAFLEECRRKYER